MHGMRALVVGAALLLLSGAGMWLMFHDESPLQRRAHERVFSAAGISLRVPSGWTGRASRFDPRQRAPIVEVRRRGDIRIEVVELGNRPGAGRFVNTTLPISLWPQDALSGAPPRTRSALLGRLFATSGRSFSVQAELPRAALRRILPEVNDVVATLRVQPLPGMDAVTLARLDRPLRVPRASRRRCPRSQTTRSAPATGYTLGDGPAFPVLTSAGGIAELERTELVRGWYVHKTLWAISPTYRGPLLVRGARIDAPGEVRFTGRLALQRSLRLAGQWPGEAGWRYVPSATGMRGPGCYAFQVDGLTFSRVVVFEARRVD
jgi:hypothetical protein